MANRPRTTVLLADDDPQVLRLLEFHLAGWGYRPLSAPNKREVLRWLETEEPALVLLDLRFGEHDGVEVMRELHRTRPELPVVLLTGHGSIDSAVSAIKLGAMDYLTKPPDLNRLRVLLRQVSERAAAGSSVAAPAATGPTIWGQSPTICRLRETIKEVAATDATVLILGESGTGKELVARAVHAGSGRSGAFVPVNMAALPAELVESTLFGHEKGAFTGAETTQVGCCEAADNGTLFLDEIGEMDVALQAKTLRFLQDRSVLRVGATRPRQVNVRVVAATNRDLTELIRQGRFREDLYYRLNVVPLTIPALRERREDIPELANGFLAEAARRHRKEPVRFAAETLRWLTAYDWPGNVRQLENTIERMVIFVRGAEIGPELVPREMRTDNGDTSVTANSGVLRMEEMERQAIVQALQQAGGHVGEAAKLLGLGQATVYRKIKQYGITLKRE